jgi:hypothetical protein
MGLCYKDSSFYVDILYMQHEIKIERKMLTAFFVCLEVIAVYLIIHNTVRIKEDFG